MTPQQTRSRQTKRMLAVAGATMVVAAGTIGLAFADSPLPDAAGVHVRRRQGPELVLTRVAGGACELRPRSPVTPVHPTVLNQLIVLEQTAATAREAGREPRTGAVHWRRRRR